MPQSDIGKVAVVLAAHGDRGGDGENRHLSECADGLAERGTFAGVFWGVLNGERTLEAALGDADACGANQIIVYPMFMSAGYFVKTVLTDKVAAAGLQTPTGIMQPLGLDKRLALLMLEHSLRASKAASISREPVVSLRHELPAGSYPQVPRLSQVCQSA